MTNRATKLQLPPGSAQIPIHQQLGDGDEVFLFEDNEAIGYVPAPPAYEKGGAAVVRGHRKGVDTVSLGKRARSSTSTRRPRRASSNANEAPAQRAPTTIAS